MKNMRNLFDFHSKKLSMIYHLKRSDSSSVSMELCRFSRVISFV